MTNSRMTKSLMLKRIQTLNSSYGLVVLMLSDFYGMLESDEYEPYRQFKLELTPYWSEFHYGNY